MHMVATNLCVWLSVIVEESRHGIVDHQEDGSHGTVGMDSYHNVTMNHTHMNHTTLVKMDAHGKSKMKSRFIQLECQ